METVAIFAVLITLAVVGAVLKAKAGRDRTYAYTAAPLLTKAERAFAEALEPCLPPDSRLLAKVRVADVISAARAGDRGAFSKISQKHLDFVIATRDWTVIAAVELNDKSHAEPKRAERDRFLEEAFRGAQVPLHFVRAAARYDATALRTLILPTPEPAPTAPTAQRAPQAGTPAS